MSTAAPVATVLNAGGTTTALAQAGDVSASEAVVFLHGLPCSHRDWDLLLPEVGTFTRAVAFDLPGLGSSGSLPGGWDYTNASYGGFVAAALAELRIERAHLVTHDFGGAWGLAWAQAEPQKWASIVLIDTGILRGFTGHKLAKSLRKPVIGELFPYLAGPSKARASLAEAAPGARPLPADYLDVLEGDWTRRNTKTMVRIYRANVPDDDAMAAAEQTLAHLDMPALVVWGGKDPYLDRKFAEQQSTAFPSADIHVLPESGHWPFRDDASTVNPLVVAFLRAQTAKTV